MIRLTVPSIDEDDLGAVRKVLLSGHLVQSRHVAEFEQGVARYAGCNHAVAVSSCTAALHLALLALGVGPNDIVVVTSYSWVATANVIELCGATCRFTDIRPDTFAMDPEALEKVLAELMADSGTAARVKAILPVHPFGLMADMPAILAIADRYGTPVIEDAACALGAALDGQPAGSWGVMGCFSFHPRKAITTGEGGMVTTNDPRLASRLRALRNHGQDPNSLTPEFIEPGFNYRLSELQGAFGVSQMSKIDRLIAARRSAAARYDTLLAPTRIRAPLVPSAAAPVFQSYVVLLPELAERHAIDFVKLLRHRDIETSIGTYHIPLTKYYRTRYGYRPGDFPNADRVSQRALSLPLFEGITSSDQRRVIDALVELSSPKDGMWRLFDTLSHPSADEVC